MAQTLETIIAINATMGSGLADVGSTLSQLGSQIDELSQKLINFGGESIDIYKDYEKSMHEAYAALAAHGEKTTDQLNREMKQLDDAARKWAASSIFHTNEVGDAINTAAHADWDTPDILANMSSAMELAQAGGIGLADAVMYLVEAQKNLGVTNDNIGDFIDMWAYASSNSVGNIELFGETLEKLGSVGRFADTQEELFALTAAMHDMGSHGSEAATLLRTTWMRLLAPPVGAGTVLSEMGWSQQDIAEAGIMDNWVLSDALDKLKAWGFSAYDEETHQAKPLLQAFSELRDILAVQAGGYDKIDKNQLTAKILGVVFGMRGIKGVLNTFNAMEHALQLRDEMQSGMAKGYGSFYSDTMMDTLYADIEIWESQVENLKARTGEALAAQLSPVLETLGSIVNDLAELDEGTFNAIVAGLEVIAAAGPGLLLAGGAFRFLAYALTPAGGFGLTLVALAAAAAAINELEEADFASQFGDMELDAGTVQTYLSTISGEFNTAYENVTKFKEALTTAVQTYTEASSTLSSGLLSDMLAGLEIAEGSTEYNRLMGLGETIIGAIKAGVENGHAETMEGLTYTYGGEGMEDEIASPIWAQIVEVLERGYEEELGRANALSQKLRSAMLSAFEDGHLTGDEISNIQALMDEANALMAKQQDRNNYLNQQRILRRAQTLGLDAVREVSEQVAAERDAEWEALMDRQAGDYFDLETFYDSAIANGYEIDEIMQNENGDFVYTGNRRAAREEDKELALADLAARQARERFNWDARFNQFILDTRTQAISSSQLSDTWDAMNELAQSVLENDRFLTMEAANAYMSTGPNTANAVRYLNETIEALGGYEKLREYVDDFDSVGDLENAGRIRQLLTISDIFKASGYAEPRTGVINSQSAADEAIPSYQEVAALLISNREDITAARDELEAARTLVGQYEAAKAGPNADVGALDLLIEEQQGRIGQLEGDIRRMEAETAHWTDNYSWASAYNAGLYAEDADALRAQIAEYQEKIDDVNRYGLWENMGNLSYQRTDAEAEALIAVYMRRIDALSAEIAGLYGGPISIAPYSQGTDAAESLQQQGVQVQVEGDTQQLEAAIDGADGQTLMEYVSGDATNLRMTIRDEDGQTLVENVTGDASQLESLINSYSGRTIRLNLSGQRLFAEGGRATQASIFGEAGPEWAIPEAHDQRTAELLNAARAASGFTWAELLARYGGLNANPSPAALTVVYSPTINAQNADGVEQKLLEDKERLIKWMEERKMLDRAEVYA